MSHFLERLTYLARRREPFADGLGELRDEDRMRRLAHYVGQEKLRPSVKRLVLPNQTLEFPGSL